MDRQIEQHLREMIVGEVRHVIGVRVYCSPLGYVIGNGITASDTTAREVIIATIASAPANWRTI